MCNLNYHYRIIIIMIVEQWNYVPIFFNIAFQDLSLLLMIKFHSF